MARLPDIRQLLTKNYRKQTFLLPFPIIRGMLPNTEAGYQPAGAEPKDFANFEYIERGVDSLMAAWKDVRPCSLTVP